MILFINIFILLFQNTFSHILDFEFNSVKSYSFIDRFSFKPIQYSRIKDFAEPITFEKVSESISPYYGLLKWKINYNPLYVPDPVLLIFKNYNNWRDTIKIGGKSCFDIMNMASVSIRLNTGIPSISINSNSSNDLFLNSVTDSGFYYQLPDNFEFYPSEKQSVGYLFFKESQDDEKSAPSIDFFSIANCKNTDTCTKESCQGSLKDLKVNMIFSNGNSYLSFDQFGLPSVSIATLVLSFVALLLAIKIRFGLITINKFHATVKILILSVLLQVLSTLLAAVYWNLLSSDGAISKDVLFSSIFMQAFANYLLIMQAILLAKGWTIVRRHLSIQNKMYLVAFSCLYLLSIVFATVWEVYRTDPTILSFRYDQPPGILVVCLRVVGYVLFIYYRYTTSIKYKRKKSFYKKFDIIFSVWFLLLPVLAIITLAVPVTLRTLFVYTWENILIFLAQISLILLYNPNSEFNKSFPFFSSIPDDITNVTNGIYTVDQIPIESDNQNNQVLNNNQKLEEIFKNIRGVGGGLAKRVSSVNKLSHELVSILRDWDAEIENDVDY